MNIFSMNPNFKKKFFFCGGGGGGGGGGEEGRVGGLE